MIYIVNKRRKIERIEAEYPNAYILDLTSKSIYAQKLSPFYPHGNIPIPFSKGATATCVEAVWQGLKVFENEGVSMETFKNATMHNLKRTVRKLGKPLGHQKGLYSNELLDYFEARKNIYLPTYKWMLENIPDVKAILKKITEKAKDCDIVFLDYNTNIDYKNLSTPLSHAGLVKLYIEGKYPCPTEKDGLTIRQQKKNQKQRVKWVNAKLKKSLFRSPCLMI